jgi:hypothetical protein
MWRVFGGAALTVGGIVALIVAHAHRPPAYLDIAKSFGGAHVLGKLNLYSAASGWSRTAYDLVHITGVVLVVAGALLMIVGLVALARRARYG